MTDLLELARTAVAAYDLPRITGLRVIETGNNTTVEVGTEDRNRFVLRIHRPAYRTLAHINSELRFLGHLMDSGVPVPQAVPARHGSLVVEAYDRYCDLLTWVAGDVVLTDDGLDADAVRALGRACGLLHNASARFVPPADFELPRWDAGGMFTAQASPFRPLLDIDEILSPADRVSYEEIAERTRAVYDEIAAEDTFGVIHGDYILGNCHLRRSENAWHVGVFDFDDCGWGYYLYDLCPLLANLAGYPGAIVDNPGYPVLRSAYLDGYRTVRELPVAWEKHLPVLMAARNANHVFCTAGLDVSPTPREDAAWRMGMARRCLELPY
jgi:Ser/Thr protein kinase RdoA (MazF antagonist)